MLQRLKSADLKAFTNVRIPLLILRVFAGFFMLYGHGWGKLMNVFTGNFPVQFNPIGIGPELSMILSAFAEGICSMLIIVGYFTRAASLFLMINMSVALLFVHLSDPFGDMEKALLFLVIFTVTFLLGPGKLSLDAKFSKQMF